ncbi:phage N-6-adenine-methyltransferase [Sodalis ligni]|uniref:phage N-6-adenine-methyltransferase n=1 Tax=Sodalis ligni TaxID=2697027 RepID=UPI00193F3738|nr:phage N-6-adenine-methyltransferase [Sodalis ligni]QWA09816.1 phage N-6-adenine-methyltransferase [Sodalis ligni]
MNHYCVALEQLHRQPAHKLKEIGDQWRTPDPLFWGINAMFGPLVLDLFADESNAKCEAFYSAADNALSQDWSARLVELNGAAFANPPYSRASQHDGQYITGMRHIMAYAAEMRERGGRYVFLIKAATSEVWWPEQADHISFIRGRVGFDVPVWFKPSDEQQVPTGAFFAGAIAVFDKNWRGPAMGYVSRDQLEAQGNAFLAQIRREAQRINHQQNIPEIIPLPETNNKVWPEEVHFLFDQVPAAENLPAELQNKIRHHIHRMKLDGMPTDAIISQTVKLTAAMGATA